MSVSGTPAASRICSSSRRHCSAVFSPAFSVRISISIKSPSCATCTISMSAFPHFQISADLCFSADGTNPAARMKISKAPASDTVNSCSSFISVSTRSSLRLYVTVVACSSVPSGADVTDSRILTLQPQRGQSAASGIPSDSGCIQ